MFRPPHEAELLSESKELNVNFQDLESFLADPDPHDLMRIRPRHPNGHFGACIRLVYVPPVYVAARLAQPNNLPNQIDFGLYVDD